MFGNGISGCVSLSPFSTHKGLYCHIDKGLLRSWTSATFKLNGLHELTLNKLIHEGGNGNEEAIS